MSGQCDARRKTFAVIRIRLPGVVGHDVAERASAVRLLRAYRRDVVAPTALICSRQASPLQWLLRVMQT